ncbi:MAG: hypothetical protein HY752_05405 [Nitrospirae bacterium]|nr:hypothetical protein [Nitrospirota bacterium]
MTITDIFSNVIELTDERWRHIVREHIEIEPYKERIHEVLSTPDYVKKSKRDADVLLYYKFYSDIFDGKYMLVATKKGLRSFILTCYITDVIKKGKTLWEKN